MKSVAADELRWLGASLVLVLVMCGWPRCSVAQDDTHSKHSTQSYDFGGRLKEEYHEYDHDNDGEIDDRCRISFSYDERGRLATKILRAGPENNGGSVETTTFEYDEDSGQLIAERTSLDADGDGVVESKKTVKFTYAEDRMTEKTIDYDTDADGGADEMDQVKYRYNTEGKMSDEVITSFDVATRTPQSQVAIHFEYDGDRMISKRIDHDKDADGTYEKRETVRFQHDQHGNVVGESMEVDEDADGSVDARVTTNHTLEREVEARHGRLWFMLGNILVVVVLLFFVVRRRVALRQSS